MSCRVPPDIETKPCPLEAAAPGTIFKTPSYVRESGRSLMTLSVKLKLTSEAFLSISAAAPVTTTSVFVV